MVPPLLKQVEVKCFITDNDPLYDNIRGKRCSALSVELDANGYYPKVELEYYWEMCKQNKNFNSKFDEQAKFFDWDRKDKSSKKSNMADPRFPLGGGRLESGECRSETVREKFDTSSRYNVATQHEGAVEAADGSLNDESTGKIKKRFFKIYEIQILLRCQYYLWTKDQRTYTLCNISIFHFQLSRLLLCICS